MICKLTLWCALVCLVASHGRLRNPPSRSSAWRHGFNTTINYNDNELFCGGFAIQYRINDRKCGICGDDWRDPEPRDNELGGKYGSGIITKTYKQGQVISIWVELTTNHKGWFELKLCPLNDSLHDATQECFDQHLLRQDGTTSGRIPVPSSKNNYNLRFKLPNDIICDHCVIQWHYRAGNNWGECEDGTFGLGCGEQEIFRGCADVRIE